MAQLKKMHGMMKDVKKKKLIEKEKKLLNYAEQYIQQNQQLKTTLSSGEEDYIKTLQGKFLSLIYL